MKSSSVESPVPENINLPAIATTLIPRRTSQGSAPLSFAQQRMWFMDRWNPGSPVYNIPAILHMTGPLNLDVLEKCLVEIVRRHEALRTTFAEDQGEPIQRIAAEVTMKLAATDLTHLQETERKAEALRITVEESRRPFDLVHGPLLRTRVLRLSEREHILILAMHHIVTDGWSMGVLFQELGALYGAFSKDQASPLAPLPIQYPDFSIWQRRLLQGEALDRELKYWREQLRGLAVLELPTDNPRPPVQSYRGIKKKITLPASLLQALKDLSRLEGTTLFMTLLAAFQTQLHRYSGQDDIAVGSPIANRSVKELEGLIGFFVNTLVMRTKFEGNPSFRELLRRVREVALEAYSHQDLPFEKLVEDLKPERDQSRNPLFQVAMALQNASELKLPGIAAESSFGDTGTAMFDLTLELEERPEGITGSLEYNTDLYNDATIDRMIGHFRTLLEGVVANPDQRVSELPLLTEAERRQLLVEWNDTRTDYPRDACVHQLFEAQVEQSPEAVAIIFEGEAFTYRELNERANRLAHYLIKRGVGPDVPVGICIKRSWDMVVGLMGILKAGGAYVPLDPEYPQERLDFMIRDTGIRILLTQRSLIGSIPAGVQELFCLDADWNKVEAESEQNPAGGAGAESLAYIMYTSGSTGIPKGVEVLHRGIVRLVINPGYARFHKDDRFLQLATISFDASTFEIWAPLLNGASCVIYPAALPSPEQLGEIIHNHQVNSVLLTTSLFNMIISDAPETLSGVSQLLIGGEQLSTPHICRAQEKLEGARIINAYGPTESTTITCCYTVPEGLAPETILPIGRPIANTKVYILDGNLKPMPVGIPGEIYVGGDALARGYLNRPELTAEKFIPDPFSAEKGSRLYKTGDLARYRPDGNIEFLGRIDHQVKLRGFRIELGEIEAVLRQHPNIREAAVMLREDKPGDKRLVAYAALKTRSADPAASSELRRFLNQKLPEYMIPLLFVTLDEIKLTSSGKVDRKALPAPEQLRPELEMEYISPRTPVEETLAAIWAEVLGLERVGVDTGFFELGGHSLRATQVISQVRRIFKLDIPLRRLFESPTVAGFAELVQAGLETARQDKAPVPTPVERNGNLPLSFAQQRLWFLDQWNPGSAVYNIPIILRMTGPLNLDVLEKCLVEIVRRHEALRTTFVEEQGQPVQRIAAEATMELAATDLTHLPETERKIEAQRITVEESRRPFDLVHGPLLRARVLQLSGKERILILAMHHIVADGWSIGVLFQELGILYGAFSKGQDSPLAPLQIQYPDFAVWQRRSLQGEALDRELKYWREQLRGLSVLELPTDRPRPPVQSYRGNRKVFTLPSSLLQALNNLSRLEGTTLFMTLLAAFQTQLFRYSGQDDIAVGSPIANRSVKELEGLIGFFVNTLVMRTKVEGNPSFRKLLRRVREAALEAYAHQNLPLEKIVEELKPERDPSRSPLFQVMMTLQNAADSLLSLPGITVEPIAEDTGTAKFDLLMELEEGPEGISGSLEYNTDLYNDATIERMIGHFRTLLEGIVANPDQRVLELPLLTEAERRQLLVEWNDTRTDYPRDACVHQLFEAQVEQSPEAVAIVFEGKSLTYRELNARANRLARYLIQHGTGPESLVGISMERSIEMIVALYGTIKAGAAYVPIDPDYPADRLAFIFEDARTSIVLTQEAFREKLQSIAAHPVYLDSGWAEIDQESEENPQSGASPDNAAYMIYTSGSTGKPKGVVNTHRGIVNRLLWMQDKYKLETGDVVMQKTPFGFDVSVGEFFGPLLTGATLVVARPEGHRDSRYLVDLIVKERVNVIHFVPSMLRIFLQEPDLGICNSLKRVLCSGEALTLDLQNEFFSRLPDASLLNLYGPTEAAVEVTYWDCKPDSAALTVPIGRPIANIRIHILDKLLQPVPVGIPGELHIGGIGVARGYHNRPELTAEKFIPDPFSQDTGARLYKTGDLARYMPDGVIEYLGRMDYQVKIRGYRIELGEIEAVLGQHPGVSEAAVAVREDSTGDQSLTGYVVPKIKDPASLIASDLKQFLQQKLPEYMVPTIFVTLKEMPLTSSGKVDRKALPVPEIHRPESEGILIPPQNDVEITLAGIWEEVLGVERIGVHDNFFDLGGHSLRATQVISQVRRTFNVDLPLRQLFDTPTVAGLAQQIQSSLDMGRQKHVAIAPSIIQVQKNGSNPPLFILHDLNGDVNFAHRLAVNLGASQPVYGFHNAFGTNDSSGESSLEELVSRYVEDLVAFQPNGPFCLAGYSFGSFLAYEMARQLSNRGLQVGHLAIIDSGPPHHNKRSLKESLDGISHFLKNIPWWVREDLFTSKPGEFYRRLLRKIREVGKRWKRSFNSKSEKANVADLEDIFELSRLSQDEVRIIGRHLKLLQNYRILPYSGPLTLYRARTQPLFRLAQDDLGWGALVGKGIEIVEVPGNHLSIVNEPYVRALAKSLYAALEKLAQDSPAGPS